MPCVDTIAKYLFYIFIIDFSLEMLDLIHRIYEADESFRSLDFMVHTRLYFSQIVLQMLVGTLVPIILLGIVQVTKLACDDPSAASTSIAGCLRPGRRLCHALERRHRRPALLQELPRIHHLQDDSRHQGRIARGRSSSAFCPSSFWRSS